LWTEILEYDTLYGKLFSVFGTIYVYRKPGESDLYCSKIYNDLDDDVLRTTALIILSKEAPRQPTSIAARVMHSLTERPMVQSIASWLTEKVWFPAIE
jgi:hypothetical protein